MMFANKFVNGFKRSFDRTQDKEKRIRGQRIDIVTEQVKKVLTDADQKLILMVRG